MHFGKEDRVGFVVWISGGHSRSERNLGETPVEEMSSPT